MTVTSFSSFNSFILSFFAVPANEQVVFSTSKLNPEKYHKNWTIFDSFENIFGPNVEFRSGWGQPEPAELEQRRQKLIK